MATYKISKTLLKNAMKTMKSLLQKPELSKMVLAEPFENFVIWRENSLDLSMIGSKKVIFTIFHEGQQFVLVWNNPEAPHHV